MVDHHSLHVYWVLTLLDKLFTHKLTCTLNYFLCDVNSSFVLAHTMSLQWECPEQRYSSLWSSDIKAGSGRRGECSVCQLKDLSVDWEKNRKDRNNVKKSLQSGNFLHCWWEMNKAHAFSQFIAKRPHARTLHLSFTELQMSTLTARDPSVHTHLKIRAVAHFLMDNKLLIKEQNKCLFNFTS